MANSSQTKQHLAYDDQLVGSLNAHLEVFLGRQTERALSVDSSYGNLWKIISDTVMGGGKRLRPYLFMLGASINGPLMPSADLQKLSLAHELIHQALLIHDDIIDQDYVRHGIPNVAGAMRSLYQGRNDAIHRADSAALLAGDLLLSAANQLVIEADIDSEAKIKLIRWLNEAVFNVGAGELMDSESPMIDIAISDPVKIAELKTASYSFVVPLLSGAELGGASLKDMEQLMAYATAIGIAYQLRDDVDGLFGNKANKGEYSYGDLREGKRTLLIKYANDSSDKARKALASQLGNKQLNEDQAEKLKMIIKDSGSLETVEYLISKYAADALKAIDSIANEDLKTELSKLAENLTMGSHNAGS